MVTLHLLNSSPSTLDSEGGVQPSIRTLGGIIEDKDEA